MFVFRGRRGRLAASAVALASAGVLSSAGVAAAAVTHSSVTAISGAPAPFVAYDDAFSASAPRNTWSVSGTSDGSLGDQVDVICRKDNAGTPAVLSSSPAAVASDGTFTADVRFYAASEHLCVLRAVPSGSIPSDLTPFAGKSVGVGYTGDYAIGSGANAGLLYDLYDAQPQTKGYNDYDSIASCGLCDSRMTGDQGVAGRYLWFGNGSLYKDVTLNGSRRAYAVIDSKPAYAPTSTRNINAGATGLQGLTHSMTVDPATGNTVILDVEPLVTCDTFPATADDCTEFQALGVTIDRKITQDHDGRLVTIVDTLRSTDGAAHTFDLQYENYQKSSATNNGMSYRFAGESGYTIRSGGDVGPSSPTATVQVKSDDAAAPSLNNPLGAVVSSPAPAAYYFTRNNEFFANQIGTIAAGGETLIKQSYSMAETQAELDVLITQSKDTQTAPKAAITSPAGSTDSPSYTATGTAQAEGEIAGLTVNGTAVPVAADGSWTAPLTLTPGDNTIIVVVTNSAGRSTTTTRTITYSAKITPTVTPTPAAATPKPAPAAASPAPATPVKVAQCVSSRVFTVHFRITGKRAIKSITTRLDNAAPVKLKAKSRSASVDLRGKTAGTAVFTITAKTATGKTLKASRTYHPCSTTRPSDLTSLRLR